MTDKKIVAESKTQKSLPDGHPDVVKANIRKSILNKSGDGRNDWNELSPYEEDYRFRGFITPRGGFEPLEYESGHASDPFNEHLYPDGPTQEEVHNYRVNVFGQTHPKDGWINTGTSGLTHITGHASVLLDRNHPATQGLAKHIRDNLHPRENHITVALDHTPYTGDKHKDYDMKQTKQVIDEYKVPREQAERGNFNKPSRVQQFR